MMRLKLAAPWAVVIVVGAALALSAAAPAWAATAGRLDPGFGVRGKVTTRLSPRSDESVLHPVELAWAGGGKFVVAGQRMIVEYLKSGRVNRGFGDRGRIEVETTGGSEDLIRALAVDSKGRLLVADGSDWSPPGKGAEMEHAVTLRRYLPDGRPDQSFGKAGVLTTDFGLPLPRPPEWPALAESAAPFEQQVVSDTGLALAAAPQVGPAGLTYLGLRTYDCLRGTTSEPQLTRLQENGEPDPGFGSGGTGAPLRYYQGPVDYAIPAVAVTRFGQTYTAAPSELGGGGIAVERFSPGGFASPGFGSDQQAEIRLNVLVSSLGLAADSRGRPVVAAPVQIPPTGLGEGEGFMVARLDRDGPPDRSFGQRGELETSFPGRATPDAVLVGGNGKILVAGRFQQGGPGAYGFALARYMGN